MMKTIGNIVTFQAGWFACVLGAANGMPWLGPLVCLPVIALHLAMSERPGGEIRLMAAALGMGLVMDSLLVISGWLAYPNGMLLDGMAPYWILAMWILFATTLNVSMRWLRDKYALASAFGAVGGPLSYVAGAKLGAVDLVNAQAALAALAVGWAVAMPVLMRLAAKFDRAPAPQLRPSLESADA
jgi:hypothetical protein